MTRKILPNRRRSEVISFAHANIRYVATVSRFADGALAEIFLEGEKHNTAVSAFARDIAVCASLALQHGCPVETLRHALTRLHDDSAAGPLGGLLDLLDDEEGRL